MLGTHHSWVDWWDGVDVAKMAYTFFFFFQATATLSRKKLSEIVVQVAAPYIVVSVDWHRVPEACTHTYTHTHAHKCARACVCVCVSKITCKKKKLCPEWD